VPSGRRVGVCPAPPDAPRGPKPRHPAGPQAVPRASTAASLQGGPSPFGPVRHARGPARGRFGLPRDTPRPRRSCAVHEGGVDIRCRRSPSAPRARRDGRRGVCFESRSAPRPGPGSRARPMWRWLSRAKSKGIAFCTARPRKMSRLPRAQGDERRGRCTHRRLPPRLSRGAKPSGRPRADRAGSVEGFALSRRDARAPPPCACAAARARRQWCRRSAGSPGRPRSERRSGPPAAGAEAPRPRARRSRRPASARW